MLICQDVRTGHGCGTINSDNATNCSNCRRPLRYALVLRNPNSQVGQYIIRDVIGYGGFGVVYKAIDVLQPDCAVALKETFNPDDIRSFETEFQKLRLLNHPNLPRYHAMFEAEGNGFLVMEYIPGQSLEDILKRRQGVLLESQVLGYALQTCDALIYLHSQRSPLIHRDVKPANIRLTPDGLVKLVDFGLLKEGTQQTQSSRRGLTPAYAPLEQWGMGKQRTDPRSDIYSLGATLYHLLTGQEPPSATDRVSGAHDSLPPMLQLNPALSKQVALAVVTAMELDPAKRHPDAVTFKQALRGGEPLPENRTVARRSSSARPGQSPPPIVQPRLAQAPSSGMPMTGDTLALSKLAQPVAAGAPISQTIAPPTSAGQSLIPGVSRTGWALVLSAFCTWCIVGFVPVAVLLSLAMTAVATGFIAREKGYKPTSRVWLSLLLFVLGPFILVNVLINRPAGATAPPLPSYRPRLTFTLAIAGLAMVMLARHPAFVFPVIYLWGFIAEYIFVSKGRRPGLMLALCIFMVTGPLAVLVAWLTPAKRAARIP